MSLGDHYNRRVSIRRTTLSYSDTAAAATETATDVYTSVKCAIQPISARELELFGKTTAEVSHRAFVDYSTDVTPADILVETEPTDPLLDTEDTVYLVVGVVGASGKSHHKELLLLERVE